MFGNKIKGKKINWQCPYLNIYANFIECNFSNKQPVA